MQPHKKVVVGQRWLYVYAGKHARTTTVPLVILRPTRGRGPNAWRGGVWTVQREGRKGVEYMHQDYLNENYVLLDDTVAHAHVLLGDAPTTPPNGKGPTMVDLVKSAVRAKPGMFACQVADAVMELPGNTCRRNNIRANMVNLARRGHIRRSADGLRYYPLGEDAKA